jgi:rRNA processing protein Krr1/Pno1
MQRKTKRRKKRVVGREERTEEKISDFNLSPC